MTKLNSKSWKKKRISKGRKASLHLELFRQKKNTMKKKNTLIPNAKPSLGKNTQSGVEFVLTLWILEMESK